jgi:uroporphyrinogen decarboxylase
LNLPLQSSDIDYWPSLASYSSWWQPTIDERIYRHYRIDFRPISLKFSRPFISRKFFPDNSFLDETGCHRKAGNLYMEFSDPAPLEFAQEVDEVLFDPYWLDPERDFSSEGLEKEARKIDDANYAVCARRGGIFEPSWQRRGFNKFIEDMYIRPKIAEAILDKVTEIQIIIFKMLLDEVGDYATLFTTLDDLGAQTTALINPALYRKYLKPRQKKLIDLIHSKSNAKIFYHSCGNMEAFIPDLIEIGVDVLHPLQPECPDMELKKLKNKYGDKMTFCGGIGSQNILPRGTTEEVKAEVKRVIREGAPGGGYIIAPGHTIQPDVPPWNIDMMYSATIKYGRYPINL